uniref:Uncharacterized protein n=1 Tax=Nelumbo nucifera TaxID=4432 RepID=A0A822Y0J9_NELNU|nr:TPA_asm: hypothetical protein HUJ06_024631 [Nelumbo nucifera]
MVFITSKISHFYCPRFSWVIFSWHAVGSTLLTLLSTNKQMFIDMEELRVKPDENTIRKVAHAIKNLGHDIMKLLIKRHLPK